MSLNHWWLAGSNFGSIFILLLDYNKQATDLKLKYQIQSLLQAELNQSSIAKQL